MSHVSRWKCNSSHIWVLIFKRNEWLSGQLVQWPLEHHRIGFLPLQQPIPVGLTSPHYNNNTRLDSILQAESNLFFFFITSYASKITGILLLSPSYTIPLFTHFYFYFLFLIIMLNGDLTLPGKGKKIRKFFRHFMICGMNVFTGNERYHDIDICTSYLLNYFLILEFEFWSNSL